MPDGPKRFQKILWLVGCGLWDAYMFLGTSNTFIECVWGMRKRRYVCFVAVSAKLYFYRQQQGTQTSQL